MYSKHCHFIPEGGGMELHAQKLEHLPYKGMYVKLTPLSTGVETEYKIEKITLVMQEVTTTFPAPPGGSTIDWEHKWVIEVAEV